MVREIVLFVILEVPQLKYHLSLKSGPMVLVKEEINSFLWLDLPDQICLSRGEES